MHVVVSRSLIKERNSKSVSLICCRFLSGACRYLFVVTVSRRHTNTITHQLYCWKVATANKFCHIVLLNTKEDFVEYYQTILVTLDFYYMD